MNKTKPPKNRSFLGFVRRPDYAYWGIFFWATGEDGVIKSCYVDAELYDMPEIEGWVELPDIPLV